ncbi:MAG: DUF4418 family protein [Spirochaetaceae bacterium]|jgi:uncharacterized membrane protein YedE/YeeE|nr:DUF4418 family protein [Spirochaetaceae bacterium]
MKIRIIGGAAAIVLGLLVALGPQFLFKVCEPTPTLLHTNGNFMKCHWTAQAEVGVGLLITALGIALTIFASPKTRLGLVIGILFSGVLALLIPHVLIGGCGADTMTCRKVAFPAITVISILLLIGGSFYAVYLARKKE